MKKIKLKKGEIIPLTFDPMFTEIFNNENNICILEDFLSCYLDIPYNKIKNNLKLSSRNLNRNSIIDSKKEVDILLNLDGEKINIELNNTNNKGIIDRNVVYIGKIHGTQLKRGFKTYNEIKKTIQINLDNENHTKNLIEEYYLKNKRGEILTEKLRIDILNLEKGSKMSYTNCERENMLIRWCKVFKSKTKKELKIALKEITSNKSKNRLLEHVDKLSGDDEMIKIYTNLSRRELEYNTIMEDKITEAVEKATKEATQNGIEQGIEQGSNQRNIEIAKNLLKANIDINVISSSTGLSKEEIEKLA